MTKQEFLLQLQRDLNDSIGSKEAAPLVAYYQEYIEIQVRKGRSQEEVTEELGNPKWIARSIADAAIRKKQTAGGLGSRCRSFMKKVKKWFEALQ